MKHFAADVVFPNAAAAADAAVALAELNLDCAVNPDVVDIHSAYVWVMITGVTKLAELEIGDWLSKIVGPLGGDVSEWAYGEPWKIRE
jgi:hypothetical protein